MIELVHLRKEYELGTPLEDVNAVINDGDIISVIGPSGTGKSTLLRCINMIERPTSGQVIFNGEDITAPGYDVTKVRQKMGMVFQSFNLFGHLTVIENIMLAPMELLKASKQDAYDEGMRLLKQVGLADRALSYPDELSGGQKQRVAIARTLAMDPEVILFDEPTSALDPTMVGEVESVMRDLSGSGKTLMIVTHEMRFAKSICNRVFYMDQGGIYDDDTPEVIFDNPQKERTRRFIHRLKVLEMLIESHTYDYLGEGAEIDRYCSKNQIPPKTAGRIRLAIEELVNQILLPTLADPKIDIVVEYNEKEDKTAVDVKYNGPAFNPQDTDNKLSLSIFNSDVSEFEFNELAEDEYSNHARFSIC